MTSDPVRIHAIYAVAGDEDLFPASLGSIYDQVDGITVITGYDTDWSGAARRSDRMVDGLLRGDLDPDRRVQLLIERETNEARSRNRAMDFAAGSASSRRVRQQSKRDRPLTPPDYFLIIDADEVYEAGSIDRLRAYMDQHRRAIYRVGARRYFKHWTYRVTGLEYSISLVRADVRLPYLRRLVVPTPRRAVAKIPGLPGRLRDAALGYHDVPPDVAVFHHGSYVGPRRRISDKLASFGHAHEVAPDWIDRVWEDFDPAMRDFNPAYPSVFPACEQIVTSDLPAEIRDHKWPVGYLS